MKLGQRGGLRRVWPRGKGDGHPLRFLGKLERLLLSFGLVDRVTINVASRWHHIGMVFPS